MLIRSRFKFCNLVSLFEKTGEDKLSNLYRAGFIGVDGNRNEITCAKI